MKNPITQENFTTKISPGVNAGEAICIHWWNSPDKSPGFDAIVQLLAYSSAPVSAHFVAEAGRVSQIAGYEQIAWHCAAGTVNKNPVWIGIECNPRCSSADVLTVAELIADIWRSAGRKIPLTKHKDALPTQCPGPEYSHLVDSGELYGLAEQIYEGKEPIMITNEDAIKIADAVLNRTLENAAGNQVQLRGMLKAIDVYTGNQPERVWNHPMKNYLGNPITPQGLLYWTDNNQGQHYKLLVEANERTKALAEAVAKGGEIDQEAIERAVKEAVDKAMENYELTLAPKDKREEV